MTYAWTPGAGAYKHYPPYVNLTGNRLTVRGAEDLSGEHPQPGPTVSIDLPADQLALLCAAASQLSGVVGERDRLLVERDALIAELEAQAESIKRLTATANKMLAIFNPSDELRQAWAEECARRRAARGLPALDNTGGQSDG